MNPIRVFLADGNDPWFNLATEDWLFSDMDPRQNVLYLWRNSPTVVIGRYQNPWNECDLDAMERDNVKLARRQSGGGAVFHDLGNTNFTMMSSRETYDKQRNNTIIIEALRKFGIEAEASGRNDITVDGRKISGSAFKITADKAFHHGTLLIQADLTRLAQYLTPDKEKLVSKGIRSVRSRVANLQDFAPELTHENLCTAIIEQFFEVYGNTCPVEHLDYASLQKIPHLKDYYEQMMDWDWRFGKSPDFGITISERLSWARLEFHIEAVHGHISDIHIHSDALIPELIEAFMQALKDIPYEKHAVKAAILELSPNFPEHQEKLEETAELLISRM